MYAKRNVGHAFGLKHYISAEEYRSILKLGRGACNNPMGHYL